MQAPSRVVVHHAALDVAFETRRWLEGVLSEAEHSFAARFRITLDRNRWVVARATLRIVLAHETGVRPVELRFEKGQWGKPYLPDHPDLCFNLSHSGALGLIAVSRCREVGVDVERCEPGRLPDEVAWRFFSPAEKEALASLPSSLRSLALVRTWCRKEAYAKARGRGLSLPLDSFDVEVDPSAGPRASRLLATRPVADDTRRWDLGDVAVEPGYVAAIAVEVCDSNRT